MVSKLSELVDGNQVGVWLVIAFLAGYFIYKEWPEFKRRVSSGAVKEQQEEHEDQTIMRRLECIEADVREIKEKLDRDYQRINRLDAQIRRTDAAQAGMSEELEIIMEALLGTLGGLQELGANGPTTDVKERLQRYLNRKAHQNNGDNGADTQREQEGY